MPGDRSAGYVVVKRGGKQKFYLKDAGRYKKSEEIVKTGARATSTIKVKPSNG
jgi:hypothetical protein